MKLRIFVVSMMAFSLGCDESTQATADLSYHRDVRPLIEDNCIECHLEGGIGPFELGTFDQLKAVAPLVADSVEHGRMPPWLPDPDCRHFEGERLMSDDQKRTITQWIEAGMPEGNEADYAPSGKSSRSLTLADLGEPTMTLKPKLPYTPNSERPDDYRCFVLDREFEEEMYLATTNVVPDKADLVHHVILFLVPPQFVDAVKALDEAEEGVGYTCFGGVGAGSPQPLAGWVPGNPVRAPARDVAFRVPQGAKLVMQMHYNTLAASPAPDQTEVRLWFADERPEFLLNSEFFANVGIDIQPGDANSKHERVMYNRSNEPWTLIGTSPHMHLLGKSQRLTKISLDGSESCLVDIPRWDFNWQQSYIFNEDEIVTILPGEGLRLECAYDNSKANQPLVNGVQIDPVRVTWGEGTLDEMCLNSLVFIEPYAPLPEVSEVCTDFQGCYDSCMAPGNYPLTGCLLQCGANDGCAECLLSPVVTCVIDDCGPASQTMIDCFEECGGRDDSGSCIANNCTNAIVGFDFCAAPIVRSGICDAGVSACGVAL